MYLTVLCMWIISNPNSIHNIFIRYTLDTHIWTLAGVLRGEEYCIVTIIFSNTNRFHLMFSFILNYIHSRKINGRGFCIESSQNLFCNILHGHVLFTLLEIRKVKTHTHSNQCVCSLYFILPAVCPNFWFYTLMSNSWKEYSE